MLYYVTAFDASKKHRSKQQRAQKHRPSEPAVFCVAARRPVRLDKGVLQRLRVQNYRSLQDVSIELGGLTVVTGANGSGKSNLYQALGMVQAAAGGRFKQALLDQGGMPSALWAGPRGKGPVRMRLSITFDDLSYSLVAGVVQKQAANTLFVLDPDIKEESLHLGPTARTSTCLIDRGGPAATLTTADGERELLRTLDTGESVLAQIGDPARFPELTDLAHRLRGWRFYHHFDTSPQAPVRRPQPGVRTSVLAPDGHDLAAAIATLDERGDGAPLREAVARAFDGHQVLVESPTTGHFEVRLKAPGLRRPLTAAELSDGQLRFLCLAMALLTTRPPELLVLNEPETSLHPDAVVALAPLILEASRHGQVWVATHDAALRAALAPSAHTIDLSMVGGCTTVTLSD
jgi:predicted ATPase